MAKFGLFDGSNTKPSQEYEGEKMIQSDEFVQIIVGMGANRNAVASTRLAPRAIRQAARKLTRKADGAKSSNRRPC
jgi:hypothetical protein